MMHLPLPSSGPGLARIAQTRKMRWWYEALADYMLANPTALQNDIAAHFGRSAATISLVINTDAFKAYFRQRRNEFQTSLGETVKTKLMNVADKSLDAILDKLEKKRDTIPLESLQKNTEMTLKALGYGNSNGPSVVVNTGSTTHNSVVVPNVSLADLEVARQALRNAQAQSLAPPILDGEFTDSNESPLEGGDNYPAESALGRGATAGDSTVSVEPGVSLDDLV